MKNLFIRNEGYVSAQTQERISSSKVLIAGCGIGSQIALAAARLGVQHFVLIDGDTIQATNLNRQAFSYEDIGEPKVQALKRHLLAINPECKVEARYELLSKNNAQELVGQADFIFDTIDFLDLPAIVALHDWANELEKPLLSLFSAGWGACLLHPPTKRTPLSMARQLFHLNAGELTNTSYTEAFSDFFSVLLPHLNESVQKDLWAVLKKMQDNQPCPASHVVVGAQLVAGLGLTAFYRIMESKKVTEAPEMIIIDLETLISDAGVKLA